MKTQQVKTPAPPMVHFRRHHGDEYLDELKIEAAGQLVVHATTAIRYKASDFSGDEWRTSVSLRFLDGARVLWRFDVRSFDVLARGLPIFFLNHGRGVPLSAATMIWLRKGHVVYRRDDYAAPFEAATAFGWEQVIASERTPDEVGAIERLPEEIDHLLCFQPGCSAPHAVEYRLHHLFSREGYRSEQADQSTDYRRRFCLAHANRGDCGLEDAQRNYEQIGEVGPALAPTAGKDAN